MQEKTKEEKKMLNELNQSDETQAKQVIKTIREKGSAAVIPDLIDIMANTQYDSIRNAIHTLLNDIKSPEAVPVIMAAIQNSATNKKVLPVLVNACWQNGLNFSDYMEDFVNLVINSEFQTAFDAFTVIENMDNNLNSELIDDLIDKIKSALLETNEDKKLLLKTLIDVLEGKKEKN